MDIIKIERELQRRSIGRPFTPEAFHPPFHSPNKEAFKAARAGIVVLGKAKRKDFCTLCHCRATTKVFGFRVCKHHKVHGESSPDVKCPVCGVPK